MLHWSMDGFQAADSSTQMKPKRPALPTRGAGESAQQGVLHGADSRRMMDDGAVDLQLIPTSSASGMDTDGASDGLWYGETPAFPFQLQLVPTGIGGSGGSAHMNQGYEFACPICLRASELPVRQDCGHVLCLHCIQQGYMSVGGCPLCQTRQIFSARSRSEPPVLSTAVTRTTLTMTPTTATSAGMMSIVDYAQPNPAQEQGQAGLNAFQDTFPGPFAPHLIGSMMPPVSMGLGANGIDLAPDPNDLHLETLSDFSDMIDLAELVSSDNEVQRPPMLAIPRHVNAAALHSASNTTPTRSARTAQRKVSGARPRSSSAGPSTSRKVVVRSSSAVTGVGNKRKRKSVEGPAVAMRWEEVQVLGTKPEQRYDCGCTVYGSYLFVVGGIVGKLRSNDLYYIDLAEGPSPCWMQPPIRGAPPPTGSLLQIFVVDDTLYVIGGTSDGKFLSEVYTVNLAAKEWTWEKMSVVGRPPSIRYWYSITLLGKILVLYGGYGHPNRLSDTFALRFDMPVPTWVELSPRGNIPGPASTHSACVHNGKMYIFGGYDGKFRRGHLHSFAIERITAESIDCVWLKVETRGKAPSPRYTHTAAVIGSKMIVYGGNSGCLKGDVTVLDFDGDMPTWSPAKCEPPPSPREWHRVVVFDGAMYVFGGHTSAGNDNGLFRLAFQ